MFKLIEDQEVDFHKYVGITKEHKKQLRIDILDIEEDNCQKCDQISCTTCPFYIEIRNKSALLEGNKPSYPDAFRVYDRRFRKEEEPTRVFRESEEQMKEMHKEYMRLTEENPKMTEGTKAKLMDLGVSNLSKKKAKWRDMGWIAPNIKTGTYDRKERKIEKMREEYHSYLKEKKNNRKLKEKEIGELLGLKSWELSNKKRQWAKWGLIKNTTMMERKKN